MTKRSLRFFFDFSQKTSFLDLARIQMFEPEFSEEGKTRGRIYHKLEIERIYGFTAK